MNMTGLCAHLHNYFEMKIYTGSFTISGGSIGLPFSPLDGQYYRIVGSVLNDGVYKHPTTALKSETFNGEIWAMAVPPDTESILAEIATWEAKNPASASVSESFGGYSYSKATDAFGAPASWQTVFRARLNQWRRV